MSNRIYSIKLGDVDNDGDLDFLTTDPDATRLEGTVSVRLNDGTGGFSGNQDVLVSPYCRGVVVGDVDGDGDLDLAALSTTGIVSVCLNNGSGTFSNSQRIALATANYYTEGLRIGDVDGDSDLLIPESGSNTVSIGLNNGTGTFSGGQAASVATAPVSVALGDVDGDGDLDLLTANGTSALSVVCVRLNGATPLSTVASKLTVELRLFPNPARETVTITGAAPNAPLTIFDFLGRAVLTEKTDAGGTVSFTLPTGLPAGIYVVRSGPQIGRLLVE